MYCSSQATLGVRCSGMHQPELLQIVPPDGRLVEEGHELVGGATVRLARACSELLVNHCQRPADVRAALRQHQSWRREAVGAFTAVTRMSLKMCFH